MKEIKNDLLKRMLAKPFGFNLSMQNLLEATTSDEGHHQANGTKLTQVDDGLKQRAGRRLYAEELNKQQNIEDVVQRADNIMQSEPVNNEMQEDFFARPYSQYKRDCR